MNFKSVFSFINRLKNNDNRKEHVKHHSLTYCSVLMDE